MSIIPDEQTLKELHGRGVNGFSDVYSLPADKMEMDRLSLQHMMWKLMVGGLYPRQIADHVKSILSPKDGSPAAVLDVGSGSGAWAAEIASLFPDVSVVGLDLAESKPKSKPPNCSFVIGDCTQGLPQYAGKFDLVHCRTVVGHLADPAALVKTIGTVLKPGGLFIIADVMVYLCNERKERLQPANEGINNEGRSWFARWLIELSERTTVMKCLGHEQSPEEVYVRFLQEDDQFQAVGGQLYYNPINWSGKGVENGDKLGPVTKLTSMGYAEAGKPALLASGMSAELVETLLRNVHAEIEGPTLQMYSQWPVAWAFKRGLN